LKAYAIVSASAPGEAVALFLECDDAETFLAECLTDEPDWKDVLRVVPIELDERNMSAN
jgi:hypothetical protein